MARNRYTKKAARFVELTEKGVEVNAEEKAERHALRKELEARGLEPKKRGVVERAILLDNRPMAVKYCQLAGRSDNQAEAEELGFRLREAGLQRLDHRRIERMLGSIGAAQRAAKKAAQTKKRGSKHSRELSARQEEEFLEEESSDL